MGDDAGGPAKRTISLGLGEHCDELFAAMMSSTLLGGGGDGTSGTGDSEASDPHTNWLRERCREIVPVVLPAAVRSIETGEPLDAHTRDTVRASADGLRHSRVPFPVILRGGVPAVRAFSAFIQARHGELSPREVTIVMGRAALIAHELGACWAEAYLRDDPCPDGEHLKLTAMSDELEQTTLDMLALAAEGRSNEQIAQATAYSPQAVKWHLARVMRLWNAPNRAALVSIAFIRGVLTPKQL